MRARLLARGHGWNAGDGPQALLACPPGELHDLGLICFALALHTRDWRIVLLGQSTPGETLLATVESLRPSAVVIAATDPALLEPIAAELGEVDRLSELWIGGPAASAQPQPPGRLLTGGAVEAAGELDRQLQPA